MEHTRKGHHGNECARAVKFHKTIWTCKRSLAHYYTMLCTRRKNKAELFQHDAVCLYMYHIIPYEVINVGTWNTVRKLLVVTQGAPGHACSAGLIAPTTSVFASPSSQTRYSNLYGFCVSYSSSAVGLAYSKSLLVRLGLLGSNSSPRLFWSRAAILESCRIIPCDPYICTVYCYGPPAVLLGALLTTRNIQVPSLLGTELCCYFRRRIDDTLQLYTNREGSIVNSWTAVG